MAIDQKTLDTDLAGLMTAFTALLTAVDAAIAAKPAADLTAEDQQVKDLAAAAGAELAKISPPQAKKK
jgi:hypothetical protein